jgi:hypothetical protein
MRMKPRARCLKPQRTLNSKVYFLSTRKRIQCRGGISLGQSRSCSRTDRHRPRTPVWPCAMPSKSMRRQQNVQNMHRLLADMRNLVMSIRSFSFRFKHDRPSRLRLIPFATKLSRRLLNGQNSRFMSGS